MSHKLSLSDRIVKQSNYISILVRALKLLKQMNVKGMEESHIEDAIHELKKEQRKLIRKYKRKKA